MVGIGRVVGRSGVGRHISGVDGVVVRPFPEDREEDGVERLDLRVVGHEHPAGGPVQPPPADRAHERERPRELGRPLGRHRHTGLVQAPAQRRGERRQVELDRLNPKVGHSLRTSASRPAARITS